MIRLIFSAVSSGAVPDIISSGAFLFKISGKKRCSCSCFKKPEYGTMDTWDRQKSGGYYL